MSLSVLIDKDIQKAFNRLRNDLERKAAKETVGGSVARLLQRHFIAKNKSSNRLGGKRTNYWSGAAKATRWEVSGDDVIVTISHEGVALHLFGGTVRPKNRKFLAIPARAEAHGRKPGEFLDLEAVSLPLVGGALVRRHQTAVSFRRTKKGPQVVRGGLEGGEVMYWLVKSSRIRPDPSTIPTAEAIRTEAALALQGYVKRASERSDAS